MTKPCFDIWVCQGRMCSAHGADALKERIVTELEGRPEDRGRCRVLRGGCYGLCELSANVVVRRWPSAARLPDPSVDRLSLTGKRNETVYCQVQPDELVRILSAHLDEDRPAEELTRAAREAASAPPSSVAERIRALRRRGRRER